MHAARFIEHNIFENKHCRQQNSIIYTKKQIILKKEITNNIDNIKLSDIQDELLDTIAKQTLLVAVETITFEWCIFLWILCIIILYLMNNVEIFVVIFIIDGIGWAVYLIVVPLTTSFSFAFAKKDYNYWCGKLHLWMLNWYRKSAIRELSRPKSNKNEYLLMNGEL